MTNYERVKEWRHNSPERYRKYLSEYRSRPEVKVRRAVVAKKHRQTPRGKYFSYKNGAIRRGLTFDLTFEQFMEFWQGPCAYCGSHIDTVGIDRIDNAKGYVAGNIVPCCEPCNMGKREMTLAEYFEHCQRVVSNMSRYK